MSVDEAIASYWAECRAMVAGLPDAVPEAWAFGASEEQADSLLELQTLSVEIVPFDDVTQAHARAEGEGDLSLTWWREAHERFWRAHSTDARGFDATMPVVCERFRLMHGVRLP